MTFTATGSYTRSFRTSNADEATASLVNQIRPGIVGQLAPGREMRFEGDYYVDDAMMVSLVRTGGEWDFEPHLELDAVMAWIGVRGKAVVRHSAVERALVGNDVLLTSMRSTKRVGFAENFEGFVIASCSHVVRQEMVDYLGYEIEQPFDFMTQVATDSRFGQTLQSLGAALHAGLTGQSPLLDSPIGLKRHRDAFAKLMLMAAGVEQISQWGMAQDSSSMRHVRRAEEYMQAHAMEPIGIGDVAAHLGVSTRSLQYMFKRHLDTNPLAVLNRYRLEGVRHDLVRGGPEPVALVAARWGFVHLGRFSRQYQTAFHERPSETARSARRRRQG